jgi:transposase-like protein
MTCNRISANDAALLDGGPATLISLAALARRIGRTSTTLWRWRKRGWLATVNIAGKPYCTAKALAEFTARAERGDFAKSCPVPRRSGEGGQ